MRRGAVVTYEFDGKTYHVLLEVHEDPLYFIVKTKSKEREDSTWNQVLQDPYIDTAWDTVKYWSRSVSLTVPEELKKYFIGTPA